MMRGHGKIGHKYAAKITGDRRQYRHSMIPEWASVCSNDPLAIKRLIAKDATVDPLSSLYMVWSPFYFGITNNRMIYRR
jgi:hypothetical protein